MALKAAQDCNTHGTAGLSVLSRILQLNSFVRGVFCSPLLPPSASSLHQGILIPLACERVQSYGLNETVFLLLLDYWVL